MATSTADIYPSLSREVNVPGFELFPDLTIADGLGYIADGFWEARLEGMLAAYTIKDGTALTPPQAAGDFITNDAEDDFPDDLQMLVVILAGMRLLRRRIFGLAQRLSVKSGPVEYEAESSATVIRAVLDGLTDRLDQLKVAYSTNLTATSAFFYLDGVAQRNYSLLNGLSELQILL